MGSPTAVKQVKNLTTAAEAMFDPWPGTMG